MQLCGDPSQADWPLSLSVLFQSLVLLGFAVGHCPSPFCDTLLCEHTVCGSILLAVDTGQLTHFPFRGWTARDLRVHASLCVCRMRKSQERTELLRDADPSRGRLGGGRAVSRAGQL